jgi:uncharacterized membrane protein
MEEQIEASFEPAKIDFEFPSEAEKSITEPIARPVGQDEETSSVNNGNSPANTFMEIEELPTFGQRLADRVTLFGGSWTFLIYFGVLLFAWVVVNSVLLPQRATFDPYPYIFLNLVLSMMSAVQAPVIMMSQNRQDEKDRAAIKHDYEVNLKTEREIQSLHRKLDSLTALHEAEMERLLRLLEQHSLGDTGRGAVNSTFLFDDCQEIASEPAKSSGSCDGKEFQFQKGSTNGKRHSERVRILR